MKIRIPRMTMCEFYNVPDSALWHFRAEAEGYRVDVCTDVALTDAPVLKKQAGSDWLEITTRDMEQ